MNTRATGCARSVLDGGFRHVLPPALAPRAHTNVLTPRVGEVFLVFPSWYRSYGQIYPSSCSDTMNSILVQTPTPCGPPRLTTALRRSGHTAVSGHGETAREDTRLIHIWITITAPASFCACGRNAARRRANQRFCASGMWRRIGIALANERTLVMV